MSDKNQRVWIGERIYEDKTVYSHIFASKSLAKKKVSEVQGGSPEDFTWEGLNYEGDENEKVVEELELGEMLVVKEKIVKEE